MENEKAESKVGKQSAFLFKYLFVMGEEYDDKE